MEKRRCNIQAPHTPSLRFQNTASQMSVTEVFWKARCQRTYAAAHTYHINSISVSSDQETFISADDLRVNLW